MKLQILVLALLVASVFQVPAQAASGQQCDQIQAQVTAGGALFEAHWCGPSEGQVGAQAQITLQTQLSVAGLTLTIPAASTWTYVGCSYVSATTGGGTLTASTVVRVSQTAPLCTVSTSVSVLPLIGAALGNFPVLFAIYDPTATLPTDFNNAVEVESWPDVLNVSADVEIQAWPELVATIQAWPELFASVEITDWPTLLATLNGDLDITADVVVSAWPELVATIQAWPDVLNVSADVEIQAWPELVATIQAWPELFASVDIDQWPTLFSVLSGTVEVTGVDIGDVNTTIGSIGNITNEAQQSNLQEATGLDGPDWFMILFFLLAAIVIWHRTRDEVIQTFMGVCAIVAGVFLMVVWSLVHWAGLLALGICAALVGCYIILRNGYEWYKERM